MYNTLCNYEMHDIFLLSCSCRLRASDWDGSCLAQADLKAGKSHTHNLRHLSLTGGSWKDEEMSEKVSLKFSIECFKH